MEEDKLDKAERLNFLTIVKKKRKRRSSYKYCHTVSISLRRCRMSVSSDLSFNSTSSEFKNRYLCSYCHYLLVDPEFIVCGHQYCSLCLGKIIK